MKPRKSPTRSRKFLPRPDADFKLEDRPSLLRVRVTHDLIISFKLPVLTTKWGTLVPYRGETAMNNLPVDLNSHHLTQYLVVVTWPPSPSYGWTPAVTMSSLGLGVELELGLGRRRRRDGHGPGVPVSPSLSPTVRRVILTPSRRTLKAPSSPGRVR